MSARRPHPKSRLGCSECKRRRVKCDEVRPRCRSCLKRDIQCSFELFDPIPHSGISASAKTAPDPPLSHSHVFPAKLSPDDSSSPSERSLLHESVQDALLQHLPASERSRMKPVLSHFAAHTIPTISVGSAIYAAWRETIPLIAHKTYVLHGVLAVGSLHLSTLTKVASERESYENMAATQMNTRIAQYREDVQNVSTDNAEALFAFSTMFTIFVHSTSKTERQTAFELLDKKDLSPEDRRRVISGLAQCICRIFRSIRGVLLILVPCWHHIRNGSFGPVVERDWWPARIPVTNEELEHDQRLRNLEKMWAHPGRSYEYFFDTLARALKSLRETSALVARLATLTSPGQSLSHEDFDWTSIVPWITEMPYEFLTLLDQGRMEAWVIMAHYALLPGQIESSWWLDGWAVDIFKISALAIGEDNWEWISWPASILKIDLNSLRAHSMSD